MHPSFNFVWKCGSAGAAACMAYLVVLRGLCSISLSYAWGCKEPVRIWSYCSCCLVQYLTLWGGLEAVTGFKTVNRVPQETDLRPGTTSLASFSCVLAVLRATAGGAGLCVRYMGWTRMISAPPGKLGCFVRKICLLHTWFERIPFLEKPFMYKEGPAVLKIPWEKTCSLVFMQQERDDTKNIS